MATKKRTSVPLTPDSSIDWSAPVGAPELLNPRQAEVAAPPPSAPESAEAGALDAARATAAARQQRLMSFGARQRAADPAFRYAQP